MTKAEKRKHRKEKLAAQNPGGRVDSQTTRAPALGMAPVHTRLSKGANDLGIDSDLLESGSKEYRVGVNEISRRITRAERWMIFLTLLVMLCTAAQAIFAGLQWRTMKIGGDQTSEQIDRIVKYADRISAANEQALKQNKVAFDASVELARTEQRAWVGIKDGGIGVAPNRPLIGQVSIVNTGKTLALNVGHATVIMTGKANENMDEWAERIERENSAAGFKRTDHLSPGQEVICFADFGKDKVLTAQEVASIKDGSLKVYFFGDIIYDDVFGRTHHTQFGGVYDPNSGGFSTHQGQHQHAD